MLFNLLYERWRIHRNIVNEILFYFHWNLESTNIQNEKHPCGIYILCRSVSPILLFFVFLLFRFRFWFPFLFPFLVSFLLTEQSFVRNTFYCLVLGQTFCSACCVDAWQENWIKNLNKMMKFSDEVNFQFYSFLQYTCFSMNINWEHTKNVYMCSYFFLFYYFVVILKISRQRPYK